MEHSTPANHASSIDFSVVIVNMNASYWLRRCLTNITTGQDGIDTQVILIDNASVDDSIQVAGQTCPQILCLPQKKNIGYVPANNVGLQHSTGELVMFLNNDAELQPDCLAHLKTFMNDQPDVGAVSGQILNPDGSDQGCARRFPSIANGLFGRRSILTRLFPINPWSKKFMVGRHQQNDEPFEVEILSSACLVVRTELANELGGMDESFGLYWVDAEMCARVRAKGHKVFCVPKAKIIHHEGNGGSTKTFKQRCKSTISFHRDAYLAYTKVHGWSAYHPLRLFAAAALSARATCLLILQFLRPTRATSSGGKN
ncbi:MAG: glycosyltransferase family 2 protein [Gammaproteobacteria bacterium]|nr:glycosyltransferase family 2 protein [Gammaproteobacteria bacterium]